MAERFSLAPFAACKAVVCDLDGTLYLDHSPIPGAREFLRAVLTSGRQLFYFTNNTSKSRRTYLDKLQRLDFPAAEHQLITAADCTIHHLKQQDLFPEIFLIGNQDLQGEFERAGFDCVPAARTAAKKPRAVVLAFDTELTFEKIRTGYDLIVAGTPYLATHGDILCPVEGGRFMPDIGTFIALFATATGGRTPEIIGKPFRGAVEAISGRAGLPPADIAFVGDRLYTDIRMAQNFDLVGVLVLSGETSRAMAESSPDQPRLMVESVADLIPALRVTAQS